MSRRCGTRGYRASTPDRLPVRAGADIDAFRQPLPACKRNARLPIDPCPYRNGLYSARATARAA